MYALLVKFDHKGLGRPVLERRREKSSDVRIRVYGYLGERLAIRQRSPGCRIDHLRPAPQAFKLSMAL